MTSVAAGVQQNLLYHVVTFATQVEQEYEAHRQFTKGTMEAYKAQAR